MMDEINNNEQVMIDHFLPRESGGERKSMPPSLSLKSGTKHKIDVGITNQMRASSGSLIQCTGCTIDIEAC